MLQIKGHCSYFGKTGFNFYSRGFFRELKKLYPKLFVRNFTDFTNEPVEDDDKRLIDETTFFNGKYYQGIYPPWKIHSELKSDINIVLNETNHPFFYDKYTGVKIAYNMWETTHQPPNFFNQLLEFDQVWVPSNWQKQMLIKQGYPETKIKIVPGGVDSDCIPNPLIKYNKFVFLVIGAWGFRKATKEIIQTFLKTFKQDKNVELWLSVDAPFSKDGLTSTEKRLETYKLIDDRIKIKTITDRKSYLEMLQSCNVFLSCSRGEGWNIPLIEALACGKPSIFSNCSGQLEYADEYPLKVNILNEIPAVCKEENVDFTGNYYEPNFNHLSKLLIEVYKNYKQYKKIYIEKSEKIRNDYKWENSAKCAFNLIMPILFDKIDNKNEFYITPNKKEKLDLNNTSINNFIYKEIFDYKIYTAIPEMEIKKGDVVVDIGAHIGIFSRYADVCGASKVIAFEMSPEYFTYLKLNIRPVDDGFNCVLLNKSLIKYKIDDGKLVNGFDLNYFYIGGLFDKIDFLKIDVTGNEMLLLNSICKDLYNIINKISIKCYNLNDQNRQDLITYMNNNYFPNYYNIKTPNENIELLYFWR